MKTIQVEEATQLQLNWLVAKVEGCGARCNKRRQDMTFTEKEWESAVDLMEDLPSAIHILQRENKEMKELLREHGIKYPKQQPILFTKMVDFEPR